MTRPIFSPSTLPVEPPPDRLLLFIQQAQLTLLYSDCSSKSALNSDRDARRSRAPVAPSYLSLLTSHLST
jgi:hypothetical protein